MKLTSILAGTAIATLALVSGAGAPLGVQPVAKAEAAVNVSFSLFYDQLGDDGDWVNYRGAYVFIPADVSPDWRPYTVGHWIYTRHYGWTWISEEPFGWATYHYGRWGYADDIGWYWVPGTRWAPAWVSWRRSNNYVVWAPLPPTRYGGGIDIGINFAARDIPDYYWVAVPTRQFLAPQINVVVINEDRQIQQVVRETKYIGTPRITNNIVVNNVIDVNTIQRETGRTIRPVDLRTTDNPQQARVKGDQVTVFQGQIAPDKNAKPTKLRDVSQVKKVKRNQGGTQPGNAPATNTNGNAPATQQNTTTTPPGNNNVPAKGKVTTTPSTGGNATAPTDQTTGQGKGKNRNKKIITETPPAGQAPANDNAGQPATPANPGKPARHAKPGKSGQPAQQTEPVNPTAPAESGQPSANAPADNGQPAGEVQGRKHRKPQNNNTQEQGGGNANAPANQPSTGNNNAGQGGDQGQPAGKGKGRNKKDQNACDPSTDANCPPQQ